MRYYVNEYVRLFNGDLCLILEELKDDTYAVYNRTRDKEEIIGGDEIVRTEKNGNN